MVYGFRRFVLASQRFLLCNDAQERHDKREEAFSVLVTGYEQTSPHEQCSIESLGK